MTYKCEFCGFENDWAEDDHIHGELWGCENDGCDKIFCCKCFIDRHGEKEYWRMQRESLIVLCPDCWEGKQKLRLIRKEREQCTNTKQ